MELLKKIFVFIIQGGGVISVIAGIYNFLTAVGDGDTHGLRGGIGLIALGLALLAIGPAVNNIEIIKNSTVDVNGLAVNSKDLQEFFSKVSQAYAEGEKQVTFLNKFVYMTISSALGFAYIAIGIGITALKDALYFVFTQFINITSHDVGAGQAVTQPILAGLVETLKTVATGIALIHFLDDIVHILERTELERAGMGGMGVIVGPALNFALAFALIQNGDQIAISLMQLGIRTSFETSTIQPDFGAIATAVKDLSASYSIFYRLFLAVFGLFGSIMSLSTLTALIGDLVGISVKFIVYIVVSPLIFSNMASESTRNTALQFIKTLILVGFELTVIIAILNVFNRFAISFLDFILVPSIKGIESKIWKLVLFSTLPGIIIAFFKGAVSVSRDTFESMAR
ncbi:MAG: hypothetical protein ACPL1B_09960 [Thermoprotei archaeon]